MRYEIKEEEKGEARETGWQRQQESEIFLCFRAWMAGVLYLPRVQTVLWLEIFHGEKMSFSEVTNQEVQPHLYIVDGQSLYYDG